MKRPSFTTVLSVLFLAFMGNNFYQIYKMFSPSLCSEDDPEATCLAPYLEKDNEGTTLIASIEAVRSKKKTNENYACQDGEEQLDGDCRWNCPRCKKARPAVRRTQLWTLPPVLVIHLKRFSLSNGEYVKNTASVNFEKNNFDLSEYFHEAAPKANSSYKLYAVTVLAENLDYDPNYAYGDDDDDEDMEDEEDESDYSDDDDITWKVRRAAAKAIEAMVCLGMQCAAIEFVRNVLKVPNANSTEMAQNLKPEEQVIIDMPEHNVDSVGIGGTMRLGKRSTVFLTDNCILHKLYEAHTIDERHRHRYEVNPKLVPSMSKEGLLFVGMGVDEHNSNVFGKTRRTDSSNCLVNIADESKTDLMDKITELCQRGGDGTYKPAVRMEILELQDHPYYVGAQFHPEYLTTPLKPSPPFLGLLLAASDQLESYFATSKVPSPMNTVNEESYEDVFNQEKKKDNSVLRTIMNSNVKVNGN